MNAEGEFESISLSTPLEALMNDKFPELLLIRRSNANVSWAGAESHCFEHTHKQAVDKKASKAADAEEQEIGSSYQVRLSFLSLLEGTGADGVLWIASGGSAARIVDGELLPSHRFHVSHSTFRHVCAYLLPPSSLPPPFSY